MTALNLTAASTALLLALADDAGNWGGTPLFGGNVGGDAASKGNLTHLKKLGLLTTQVDEDDKKCSWVYFTEAGLAKIAELEAAKVTTEAETIEFKVTVSSAKSGFIAELNYTGDRKEVLAKTRQWAKDALKGKGHGTLNFRVTKA